jgi:hypothetical protein
VTDRINHQCPFNGPFTWLTQSTTSAHSMVPLQQWRTLPTTSAHSMVPLKQWLTESTTSSHSMVHLHDWPNLLPVTID